MLLDGAQHIGEAAEHMRADRLALERAGRARPMSLLADRDAKVIGPERDQPFEEADRRRAGLLEASLRVGAEKFLLWRRLGRRRRSRHRPRRRGVLLRRGRGTWRDWRGDVRGWRAGRGDPGRFGAVAFHLAAPFVRVDRLENLRSAGEFGVVEACAARLGDFGEQRGARIALQHRSAGTGPQAETVERKAPRRIAD